MHCRSNKSNTSELQLMLCAGIVPHVFLAQVFEAAPQEARGAQSKRAAPDYFL
jgi:hypothetical protein